ncbi:MAG: long-chain fatty acid--CoA ligase [Desulfarculus sp.]|nr:long-chain fatty acid--CoA ligase [Pseudomonadota bacterium]MBV1715770.1 long-chain fatty acid--CoA ligase [Desulfarculus sp.]MBU4573622.1 long-chain fatty acid--CoA ligase [Pseudomonadota bacterium]MBU4597307.1 long-chain fatty acid--CoA ligase [Pseudomonadota bacterium]MBV1739125.1 long-chain fatty acid--CoA ligase [Desulfarculus sp.]
MNVGSLLVNAVGKFPAATAIVDGPTRLSFAELDQRTRRLASAMLGAGLHPGDPVAMLFYNSAHMVEAYYATVRAGLVAVPINFRLAGREMAFMLADSGAKALFYDPEFDPMIAGFRDDLEDLRFLVSPRPGPSGLAQDYEEFLATGQAAEDRGGVSEDHPCQLMYTSGTTGRPKGAVITHRNVIWNLFNTIHGREDRAGQISIIVGPLYHTAALNNHLTIQLALGGASVLVKSFNAEGLLATIQQERATVISGSPAMYNLLMQHPAAGSYDTTSITKCTTGADKLAMETKRRLMEFFPNIEGVYDVYGCTEASPCIAILAARDSLRKDGSIGPPLPFLQARVVDEMGRVLGPDQVGELVCKGPNVMSGYHNNPEGTAEAIRDGWLHTGDLARMDTEGYLYIVDRKKDMIVSGGENIYPRELEEVLYTHPAIADAAVVGMPDEVWGESVCAFVALRPGSSLGAEEVVALCKANLASYKKPKRVEFLPEIPRNPSGKVLKVELRRQWLDKSEK